MRKLVQLNIAPGLFTENSERGAKNRWRDADHVRFYRGLPEKIGGWAKLTTNAFLGICRSVIDWRSLREEVFRGFGTNLKLYVGRGGVFYDITPLRDSGTLGNNPITTTNASTSVSIADASHGLLVGDYVTLGGATAVGGITVSGEYTVTTVTNVNAYTITHTAAASSGATGGGASVTYAYQVHIGLASSAAGLGFGAGTYGSSTYGTARTVSSYINMARIWSLDNWGEDMIAAYRDGAIYVWDSSVGVGTRASLISQAPSTVKAILVSPEARHLIALGAHDGSASDPLLIRWCDSEDYTVWTETLTNTAGSHRLDGGNEIYCGIKTDRDIVILTDTVLATMTYVGGAFGFEVRTRGDNGGILGPNAAKEFDGRVFWMGRQEFYVYDGRVKPLMSEVRSHVFDDINMTQRAKVFAGANMQFGEVWWLYPSADSTECDRYVLYNVYENCWSYGTLARTAYAGDSSTVSSAYAFGTNGYVYSHELGVDADATPLESSLESWDMEIDDTGDAQMHVKKLVPDFQRFVGMMGATFAGRKYPQGDDYSISELTLTPSTEYVNPNIRARQVRLSLSTSDLGDDWRLATIRLEVVPHGKR